MISETKLDDSVPNSFYTNTQYQKLRLDRDTKSGGLVIFIKNGLTITKSKLFNNIELIYFQVKVLSQTYNFIYCYRRPVSNEKEFLDHLESVIHTLNLNEPLFIIGDLNMNILNDANSNLTSFMDNN